MGAFEEIAKKRPQMKKKGSFTNTIHRVTSRLQRWQNYMIALTLFSRSDPSDYWLFTDLKRMLQGKRFGPNEEVISDTKAYFEAKDITITPQAPPKSRYYNP